MVQVGAANHLEAIEALNDTVSHTVYDHFLFENACLGVLTIA